MTDPLPPDSVGLAPLGGPGGEGSGSLEEVRQTITRLLADWSSGQAEAADRLFPMVYRELSAIAGRLLRLERVRPFETTELVHEAFLKLGDPGRLNLQNRRHFFNLVARAMRQVLVEEARRRSAAKRPPEAQRVPFEDAVGLALTEPRGLLSLDRRLAELEALDPRQAEVVALKVFVGLEVSEIAAAIAVSTATVKRDWRMARAWLAARFAADGGG